MFSFIYLFYYFILGLFYLVFFLFPTGTESERSFTGRESQRRLLRSGAGAVNSNGKPVKIAGIGKQHKVSRYLSRECEYL